MVEAKRRGSGAWNAAEVGRSHEDEMRLDPELSERGREDGGHVLAVAIAVREDVFRFMGAKAAVTDPGYAEAVTWSFTARPVAAAVAVALSK